MKNNKASINKEFLLLCHLCDACKDICPEKCIEISHDNDFIFYVESWGQLSCRDIMKNATEVFDKLFDELSDHLKKIK